MSSSGGVKPELGSTKLGRITMKKIEHQQRKKIEEEQTKEVYKEFVAAFEGDNKTTRTWIKGGVVNSSSEATDSSGPRVYKPVSRLEPKLKIEDGKQKMQEKPPVLGKRRGQEQKKSKLEQFKEELKLIQQQREQRHALRQGKLSSVPPMVQSELDLSDVGGRAREYYDSFASNQTGASRRMMKDRRDDYPYDFEGDNTTTNLFLGNLNPKMTEQQLCEAFGRYGPLASVKIMWPRTEEERSRGRNCGFVAFMNRRDGERALENIRGKELMGYEMKLGWGKSVPIPLYPIYIPPALLELIKPPPPSGLPFNAQPKEWLKSLRHSIKERARMVTEGSESESNIPPGPTRTPFDVNKMTTDELNEILKDAVVKVVIPTDRSILALIHRMIEFVVLEGPQFEAAIMHREQNNPQFRFLFDYQSYEHVYYRWKLWSILHGESVNNWKTDEFRMFDCGPIWRPPPVNLFSGGMPEDLIEHADYPYAPGYVPSSESDRRNQDPTADEMYCEAFAASRRCGLTEAQRGRFTQMLLDLTPSRTNIGDIMLWCLEHADSAADIADCIVESICSENFGSIPAEPTTIDESDEQKGGPSIPKLLARLFLISDILYNSSAKVPNASFFRKCFEDRLPTVFKSLHTKYKNIEGKLKAEQLKQKVLLCFRAWEDWAIYTNDCLIKLQNIFLGLVTEVQDEAELAGVPLYDLNADVAPLGVPLKPATPPNPDVEVLQNQPLVQYDGDPLDVDGSPLMDDDPDLSTSKSKSNATNVPHTTSSERTPRLFVPSKWETVDPEVVESEAVTTASRWELLVDPNPKHQQSPSRHNIDDNENEDLDGQPLTSMGSLVAYDDEDAASPNPIDSYWNAFPVDQTVIGKKSPKHETSNLHSVTISEERRNQLREIELKVLKYQDELESRRKGDKTVSEEAINKQIQRYRQRLLEKLNEDEMTMQQQIKNPNSKHPVSKDVFKADHSKRIRRDHSVSPPASTRDFRDRSPPRSLRDRPRHPVSPDENVNCDSPSSLIRSSYTTKLSERQSSRKTHRVPSEELEEGEASDDDDANSLPPQRDTPKRSHHYEDIDGSPLPSRKRQRNRSPGSSVSRTSKSYRSRSPSPGRKRDNSGYRKK